MAKAIRAKRGEIYEHSAVEEFSTEPLVPEGKWMLGSWQGYRASDSQSADGNRQHSKRNPLSDQACTLYWLRRCGSRAVRDVLDALFWDTAEAYEYLRIERHRGHDLVIFGGEDHKTGQVTNTNDCYERLERILSGRIPGISFTHRWSGQVIETPDGLPYIGTMADHQEVATGFAGNGLTFGTLAAVVISDAVLGRKNRWAELFDPADSRSAEVCGITSMKMRTPKLMARDRVVGAEHQSLRAVRRGEGKVIDQDGTSGRTIEFERHAHRVFRNLHTYGLSGGVE